MAKAIFFGPFEYRPAKMNVAWSIRPKRDAAGVDVPQSFPKHVIDAAVAAGVAVIVAPRRRAKAGKAGE